MVAYKFFNHLNNSTRSNKGYVGIKMDMEKAYDRMNWNFINQTLISIGSPTNITNLIMNCVTSFSFPILTNGVPSDSILLTREIRQGDPFSSYLFILCADVFSNLIRKS